MQMRQSVWPRYSYTIKWLEVGYKIVVPSRFSEIITKQLLLFLLKQLDYSLSISMM